MNTDTSAAVRMALGETQLVAETRAFLEGNGVYLDAFNKVSISKLPSNAIFISVAYLLYFTYFFIYVSIVLQPAKKRSKTCILVKNLPANTEKDEIKSLFIKHGQIARFLMPQHGITALVDFIEPFEAKKAFSKLAYSQFKSAPLYLEWAPENVFIKSVNTELDKDTIEERTDKIKIEDEPKPSAVSEPRGNEKIMKDIKEGDITELGEPENDTTLFVKNLNFTTTEDSLRAVRRQTKSLLVFLLVKVCLIIIYLINENCYSIFQQSAKYTVCR